MDVKYSVIATHVGTNAAGQLQVGGKASSFVLMELDAPLQLDPLTLAFAIEGGDLVDGKHRLTVDLVGPPGILTVLDVDDAMSSTPQNGPSYLTARVGLGGVTVPAIGDYEFRITVDQLPAGTIPVKAVLASGALRADFNAYHQERQGIESGQRYLRGRLVYDLWNNNDGFLGRTSVLIAQPEGGDFTKDPFTLVFPPGYERLGRTPAFSDAVRSAHDHYVLGLFGGKFPESGTVTLEQNDFIGGGISVTFDLREDPDSGGW